MIATSCPALLLPIVEPLIFNGESFYCTLNKSDVANNSNKCFIMQLLQRRDAKCFFLITHSGRVGYIGHDMVECFFERKDAVKYFHDLFIKKTGFFWNDRYCADPIAEKYSYVTMEHEQPADSITTDSTSADSQLPQETIKLLDLIFNKDNFEDFEKEFKLDNTR